MNENKINMQPRQEKYDPVIYRHSEDPDVSCFSEKQIGVLDSLIDEICNEYSAGEISRFSHDDIWESLANGEEIPLETLLVSASANYDNEVISWANRIIEEDGL